MSKILVLFMVISSLVYSLEKTLEERDVYDYSLNVKEVKYELEYLIGKAERGVQLDKEEILKIEEKLSKLKSSYFLDENQKSHFYLDKIVKELKEKDIELANIKEEIKIYKDVEKDFFVNFLDSQGLEYREDFNGDVIFEIRI